MSMQAAGAVPEFGITDRLRKAREYAEMDQAQLAAAMGVDRKTVGNNELGRVTPRRIVLRAWAMATGVSADWLETGKAPGQPEPDGGLEVKRARRDSNPKPSDP